MEQEIHITLRFNLATGKVGLNEIVYKLKQLRDPLMLKILKQILICYDDFIPLAGFTIKRVVEVIHYQTSK
jgi:hypothetical protein